MKQKNKIRTKITKITKIQTKTLITKLFVCSTKTNGFHKRLKKKRYAIQKNINNEKK
jgi:hypothetical protein